MWWSQIRSRVHIKGQLEWNVGPSKKASFKLCIYRAASVQNFMFEIRVDESRHACKNNVFYTKIGGKKSWKVIQPLVELDEGQCFLGEWGVRMNHIIHYESRAVATMFEQRQLEVESSSKFLECMHSSVRHILHSSSSLRILLRSAILMGIAWQCKGEKWVLVSFHAAPLMYWNLSGTM